MAPLVTITLASATEWITAATALGGVGFALWQLRENYLQREREGQWKRAEFVAAEIKEFFGQRAVQTAQWLLDYSRIALLPDGTRPGHDATGTAWIIDDATILSALRNHQTFDDETEAFSPQEMLCREAFDAWLTGLETLDHHVETGLIQVRDLKPYLGYWIERMADPATRWKDAGFYLNLAAFIDGYQYRGVQRLCARLGHDVTPAAVEGACGRLGAAPRLEIVPTAAVRPSQRALPTPPTATGRRGSGRDDP